MIVRSVYSLIALSLIAAVSGDGRYGDTLLAQAARRMGGPALRIDALGKDGTSIVVGPVVPGGVTVPLDDAMGKPIGTLTVPPRFEARAAGIASWLARRIYVAENLREPDPFVPGARRSPRAQVLIEQSLARFPNLVTVALHVAPLGGANRIVASSFGRIGKAGDKDDLHVERDGAVLHEITDGGRRLAVELPLLDRAGRSIGALSTSFSVPQGGDPQALYPQAVAVRDVMARHIPSRDALFAN